MVSALIALFPTHQTLLHKGVSEEFLSEPFLVLLAYSNAFGCLQSLSFHFCRNIYIYCVCCSGLGTYGTAD